MEETISGIEEIDTGVKENVISKKFLFFFRNNGNSISGFDNINLIL